ncbi:MAG: glycosyltransferase, partial [Myxococcota bacterium]|nr:glycosyltransferase [Myxococcota bacterium]
MRDERRLPQRRRLHLPGLRRPQVLRAAVRRPVGAGNIATDPRLFILSGGGTGGHVYPAVAIAEALLHRWPMVRPVFVGVAGRAEEAIVPALGYELRTVPAVGMPRLSDLPGQFRFLRALRAGISSARAIIDDLRPDAVVGTGGFASAPVLLAAVGAILPRRRRGRPA